MLKNIKSKYFLKKIFTFLNDRRKLKIIKYNKSLKNDIDININNYKLFHDSNSNARKYRGKYLNGERNGKGEEYNGTFLNFRGEYLKGKRWNGNGYNLSGKIVYRLKGGKGYVKEYDYDDNLIYEGEYLNGEKNGKGKEYYWDNRLKFEGEYLNGQKWNGKGYDGKNNIVYELKEGKGLVKIYDICEAKLIFEGEYLNGESNGKGKEYYDYEKGSISFEGEYLNGRKNGKGKEYYKNGKLKFEEEYLYGTKVSGRLYANDKLEFEGEYSLGEKWNGKGYDEDGKIIYEIKNGIINGKFREYNDYEGYLSFEGEYLNGKKN